MAMVNFVMQKAMVLLDLLWWKKLLQSRNKFSLGGKTQREKPLNLWVYHYPWLGILLRLCEYLNRGKEHREAHKFSDMDPMSICSHYLPIIADHQSTWGRPRLNNLRVQRKNQQRDMANYVRKILMLPWHQSMQAFECGCVSPPPPIKSSQ